MKKILEQIFGFSEFRPGQEEIIKSILNGNNVLAVLPTGGGKSLCYQIPALMSNRVSIVVSPLIALMKDQVDSLNNSEEIAVYINSTMTYNEVQTVFNKLGSGKIKLLYVSPERLENIEFAERIKKFNPKYIFVDEAHCISEWGHNFRPSYRKIIDFAEKLGNKNISAFTATAIPEVRRDIIEHFQFNNPRIFIKGFERDNLKLNVIRTAGKKEKVLELIARHRLPAVIYTSTRKAAEELSEFLSFNRYKSVFYHAGLDPEKRRMIQDDFMADRVKIICATNAFGMGVDKSDIRLLIHYNIPPSIENYYQEIGRAGRDGKTAKVFLLYEEKDYRIQEYFINNSYPTLDEIKQVYNTICNIARIAVGSISNNRIFIDSKITKVLSGLKINNSKLYAALNVLHENELVDFKSDKITFSFIKILMDKEQLKIFIKKFAKNINKEILLYLLRKYGESAFSEKQRIDINFMANELSSTYKEIFDTLNKLSYSGVIDFTTPNNRPSLRLLGERIAPDRLRINVEHFEALKENAKLKLDMMKNFVFTSDCRFKFILNYFGEDLKDYSCGKCDNCTTRRSETKPQLEYLEEIIIDTLHKSHNRLKQTELLKILIGDKKNFALQNNPNFGVCRHFNKNELVEIIDSLISKDLIKKIGTQLSITELGKDLFAIPEDEVAQKEKQEDKNYNLQLSLFNRLKELRRRNAKKFSQPEQLICSDETLREIANVIPSSPSKLLALKGFNQWMFNKIGEDILELILEFKLENRNIFEKQKENKKVLPQNLEKTFELINNGYSLEKISSLIKLPEAVISMQIETILEFYPDLDISSIIKKHEIELIENEIKTGERELKILKEKLPSFITFAKIRIVLAKNR